MCVLCAAGDEVFPQRKATFMKEERDTAVQSKKLQLPSLLPFTVGTHCSDLSQAACWENLVLAI